jgi:predicted transcriptional regulator
VPKVHSVYADNNLHVAVHLMLRTQQDVLPVIERESKAIIGSVSYKNIFTAYDQQFRNENQRKQHFSAKRNVLKVVLKGKQLMVEKG